MILPRRESYFWMSLKKHIKKKTNKEKNKKKKVKFYEGSFHLKEVSQHQLKLAAT